MKRLRSVERRSKVVSSQHFLNKVLNKKMQMQPLREANQPDQSQKKLKEVIKLEN